MSGLPPQQRSEARRASGAGATAAKRTLEAWVQSEYAA